MEEASEKKLDRPKVDPPNPVQKRRRSWWKTILWILGVGCISLPVLFLSTVAFFSRSEFLKKELTEVAEQQTGARVEIKSLNFNFRHGLNIEQVDVYPPTSNDHRGFLQKGATSKLAALQIKQVLLDYDLLDFFRGCICIKQLHIDGMRLTLEQYPDGTTNLDGILAYRRTLPAPPAEKTNDPPKEITVQSVSRLIGYLPLIFSVRIDSVGMKDVQAQVLEKRADGRTTKKIGLNGLDIEAAFSLINRRWVEHKLQVHLGQFEQPDVSLGPMNFKYAIKIAAHEAYDGFDLEKLDIEMGEFLKARTTGVFKFLDERYKKVDVNLREDLQFDLGLMEKSLAPFIPKEMHAQGVFDLDAVVQARIDGTQPSPFDIEKLKPKIDIKVALGKVAAQLTKLGITLEPADLQVSVSTEPSDKDTLQIGAKWQAELPAFKFEKKESSRKWVKASLSHFKTQGELRGSFPDLAIPMANAAIEVAKVEIAGSRLPKLQTPISVSLTASGNGKSKDGEGRLQIQAGELVKATAQVAASDLLTHVRAKWDVVIGSLAAWHRLAEQLQSVRDISGFPSELNGKIATIGSVEGTLPIAGKLNPVNPLAGLKANYSVEVALSDFATRGKLFSNQISQLTTKINLKGDLQSQKLNWDFRFGKLLVILPAAAGEKKGKPVEVADLQLILGVQNRIYGAPEPKTILQQSEASENLQLKVGRIEGRESLPFSIAGLLVTSDASMRRGKSVVVKDLRAQISQLGLVFENNGEIGLNDNLKPESFALTTRLHVASTPESLLPPDVKVSGGMDFVANAKSKDLSSVDLDGKMEFADLNVKILDSITKAETIEVKSLKGLIPFSQKISLAGFVEKSSTEKLAESPIKKVEKDGVSKSEADTEAALAQSVEKYLAGRVDVARSNPTQMNAVSYQDMRPFYGERHPLTIEELRFKDQVLRHFEADLQVSQNWVSINEFLLECLGGKVQGELQFAFDPKPIALRSAIHLTRLDTHKLVEGIPGLKEKAASWVLVSDPYVDAAIHLNYDFRSSDIAGGVEITSIGQEQLKMLLYYLDPDGQNATISQIKKALLIGEVKLVSIPIKNGQIGLAVDVRLLKAPIPTPKLQRFPIAELLENFKPKQSVAKASDAQKEEVQP